jgi:cysteine-rich repeat protein
MAVQALMSFAIAHADSICGDGKLDAATELCDDGNAVTGDGCNSGCELEAGYVCAGVPSTCCFVDAAKAYALQGNAVVDNRTGEITLTEDLKYQSGAAWYRETLDLSNPFSITQRVYLGTHDDSPTSNGVELGGDGMSVLLQRDPRGLDAKGAPAGELGSYGIVPVVGVELDTYNNGPSFSDVTTGDEDHTAIFHRRPTDSLVAATCLNEGNVCANFEDGHYHAVKVEWTGTNDHHLKVWFDGKLRIDYSYDLIGIEFGHDPKGVFFGFAASTGDSHNSHRFCPGAPAGYRVPRDSDGDGLDDSVDPDDDGDGLSDHEETLGIFGTDDPSEDHDRDGTPNYRDSDFWREVLNRPWDCTDLVAPIGACDGYPASIDANGDGIPGFLDRNPEKSDTESMVPDLDEDGIPDSLDIAPTDPCAPVLNAASCPTGVPSGPDGGISTADEAQSGSCEGATGDTAACSSKHDIARHADRGCAAGDSTSESFHGAFFTALFLSCVSLRARRRRR